MNKPRTNSRLMFVFFLSIFLVISGSIFSILGIRVAKKNIVSIYNDRVLPLEQLNEVTDAYTTGIIACSQKTVSEKLRWDSAVIVIAKAQHVIDNNWTEYLATYLTDEEKNTIKQAEPLKHKADQTIRQIERLLKSSETSQSKLELKQLVENNLYPDVEPFLKKIDTLILIQTKEAGSLKSLVEKIFFRIIMLALLVISMGILIVFLIKHRNRLVELTQKQAIKLANVNDELYSMNEELQTSNDELDAANQEYSVINEQLNQTNEELQKHKNDLELIVSDRVKDLMESEERYRTLVDNIMHPFIIITFDGQLLYTNQIGADFFGVNADEIGNYKSSNFWANTSQRQDFLEKLKANGFVKNEEIELYNSRREVATIIISSTIIDYYGTKAIFSVFNDITERKRIENELIESEIKLNTIIESTDDYIWAVDVDDFRVIAYNSAIKNAFMQIRKDIHIGVLMEDILLEERAKFWIDTYRMVLEKERHEMEYTIAVTNRVFHISLNLLKRGNKKIGISLFGQDITERKRAENELIKSEEKFRVTFEKAGIGIALVDTEGRPIKSNPKLQKLLGYSQEELSNMPFTQFTHPDDVGKDWDHYSELIKGNIQSYQIEKRFIRKDGETVWANLIVSMVWSPEGLPLYAIGMVEDMTEKKKIERQLLTSVIRTEENERLHFSQELHDGLGPLISAVKMYIQLLGMSNSKMKQSDVISNVERLIDEASNSIREISFKLSPHILLNFGIIDALNAYIEKVKQSNKIIVELASENFCRFPETIEIILYRVVCECINNTIKHAQAKRIWIKLSCINNNTEITYNDDGQGFDVEKTVNELKGIGLLNMQSRIKSINGNMLIDSKQGEGTEVRIKIQMSERQNIETIF